jgi:hypothetical protein
MKRDAVVLDRPVIAPYKQVPRTIAHDHAEDTPQDRVFWERAIAEHGGYHPLLKTWTPLRLAEHEPDLSEALDHITAACEAGVVEKFSWSTQLFQAPADLDWFFEQLREYDVCYRIIDRWWHALAALAGVIDEEGFITCEDIVRSLEEAIEDGEKQLAKLVLQAEYLASNPARALKLPKASRQALDAHNSAMATKSYSSSKKRLEWHFTAGIKFVNPFLFVKGQELQAREATEADIAGLLKPSKTKK